jgi:hypothetical protein
VAVPLVGVGALAAVVVGGFLIGKGSSGNDSAPEPGPAITAGDLSFHAPSGWVRADQPAKGSAVTLKHAVSIRPSGGAGSVTVGLADASGSGLLPKGLRLDSPAPQPEAVQLGDLQALHYAGLEPKRPAAGTLRLYAAPVTGGAATVACSVPPEAATDSLTTACDRTAASLELKSGRAYPLGGDANYQQALGIAVKRLNTATSKGATALGKAGSPGAQASAAGSLRAAYREAAATLRGATKNPQWTDANEKIIAALANLAGRYDQLAAAARADDPDAYGKARYFIGADEKRLRRALGAVRG